MKAFYIVYNPDKDDDAQVLARLRDYIQEKNCVSGYMDCYSFSALGKDEVVRVLSGYDCILVLGGDGTLLNAASTVSHVDIPLFGINLGTVGFLTEGEVTNLAAIMERLLSDDFSIQERMMIRGSVRSGDNAVLRKRALNDIVISRAGFSRLIGLDVYVNGSFLNAY